jgi:beta-mannanase
MTGDMTSGNGDVRQHDDVKMVYDISGKYPALIGFDFMNTTGKGAGESYNVTYSERTIALAKDTYKRGGLPAFTWHWRDPSRVTNEFYTEKCGNMKISNAMKADGSWNKSSTLYKSMVSDIDAIADIFLDMQQEGMACIFRPLHEASGGWFWWGREGAENFKKLYWLIYDEMVNQKGVHNVIWVWNTGENDKDWNPGEEYYDIISVDIYNEAFDYASNYVAFDKLKTLSNGKKMIALAENGPIPDIDREFDEEAVWSWWMPWYQTWGGKFIDKTSKEEWKKCMNDARTIELSDMPGWDKYTGIIPTHATRQPQEGFYNPKGTKLRKKPSRGYFISGGIGIGF